MRIELSGNISNENGKFVIGNIIEIAEDEKELYAKFTKRVVKEEVKKEIRDLKVVGLKEMAKEKGIEGYSEMLKAELIEILEALKDVEKVEALKDVEKVE